MSSPAPQTNPAGRAGFFRLALALCVLVLTAYAGAALLLYRHGTRVADFGWAPEFRAGQIYVGDVREGGPADGLLRRGEHVLTLNNSRVGRGEGNAVLRHLTVTADGTYTVLVERDGAVTPVTLRVEARRDAGALVRVMPDLVLSLVCCAVALFIGLSKPEQRHAQLGCVAFLCIGLNALGNSLDPSVAFLGGAGFALHFAANLPTPLYMAVAYHFVYSFPPGVPAGRFWSRLKTIFYGWGAALTVVWKAWILAIVIGGADYGLSVFAPQAPVLEAAAYADFLYFLSTFAAIVCVIVRNFRTVREADQRRRIKWIVASVVFALAPAILTTIATFALNKSGAAPDSFPALRAAHWGAAYLPLAIPVAFAYAVVRHRVLDINVVIRLGLRYLLARNVLRFLLVLPTAALLYTLAVNRHRPLGDIIFSNWFNVGLCAAVFLALKYRRALSVWLDRKFFRAAYDQGEILAALTADIRRRDSVPELSAAVGRQVEAALQPKGLHVFFRDAEQPAHTLSYSTGGGGGSHRRLAEDSTLLRMMERREEAVAWPPAAPPEGLSGEERAMLAQLDVRLIVPMRGAARRLSGLLLLGERRSEEPYSGPDRKLLEGIAGQVAIAYENLALEERVEREQRIKREVLESFRDRDIDLVKECVVCGACHDSVEERCPADGGELTLSLPVERVVENRYRLDRVLGRGGMGSVYMAWDLRLRRHVALKVLNARLFADHSARRRFEREAHVCASLNHPNIVAVHDYGRTHTDNPFLVMEYVEGRSLRDVLGAEGAVTPRVLAGWFEQLLGGLGAAHGAGVTHRDLKPDNVLLARGARGETLVKILDFGIAKFRQTGEGEQTGSHSVTAPGVVVGTLGYMPLEQLYGEQVDERADVFALGVMAIEALTGRHPLAGKTWGEVVKALENYQFSLPGDAPEAETLRRVLRRCLEREPRRRYASVAELQAALLPALRDCPACFAARPGDAGTWDASTLLDTEAGAARPPAPRD